MTLALIASRRVPAPRSSVRPVRLWHVVLAVGAALSGCGLATGERYELAFGGVLVLLCAIYVVPQASIAMFGTVSAIKAAPWLHFLPVDATLLTAGLVFGVVAYTFAKHGATPFPPAILLVVALTSLILLSVYWSPTPGPGISKGEQFEFLTVSAFVAPLIIIRTRADFSRLMFGLIVFGLIVGLTAKHTGNPGKPLTVAGGNISEEFDLATQCAVAAIAATYFMLRGPRRYRLVVIPPMVFLLYVTFAAASRGVLIGTVLAGLYMVAASVGKLIKPRSVVIVAVLLVGIGAGAAQLAGQAATRYATELSPSSPSSTLGPRGYIYRAAEQMALQYPFGRGSGAFPIVTTLQVYPHNIELELLDEYGVPALGLFGALVISVWRARRRGYNRGFHAESVVVGGLIVLLLFDAQLSHDLIGASRPMWIAFGLAFAVARLRFAQIVIRSAPSH